MTGRKRVVITGVGIYSSLGQSKEEVLAAMQKNATGIGEVARFSTLQMMSRFGAEIRDYPAETGIGRYNMCTRLGIAAAREALQDSGLEIDDRNADRFALCFGTCNGGIAEFEKAKKLADLDYESTVNFPLFQQGDCIAGFLGIKGPVVSNVTACAASGHALSVGYEMLVGGKIDAVLAGGSDTLSETVFAGFNSLQSLCPAPCAPFGRPTGLSLGEGAAFVVLETLERAAARGVRIYAEVCGYGLEQDAYHITAPHPGGDGVARAVSAALREARVRPEEIGYINVHGTGTEANDACELAGLKKALGEPALAQIALSSGKAYFGHTLGAAAVIELVSSLLAMGAGILPATLHTGTLREGCAGANHVLKTMIPGNPRYFLCNNSAFGGHNSSILLRNWRYGETASAALHPLKDDVPRRVGILGIATVGPASAGELEKNRKEIKEYIGSYYARRMSTITQYSIAGILLALRDANIEVNDDTARDIGLIFGTMYGASESFYKYLKDIFEKGPSYASALYFPDTSANTTPGSAATKLGLKGSGTTFSTGGNEGIIAAYTAYNLVRNGAQRFCLAGAADEYSGFSGEVNRVLGLDKGKYTIGEGSGFIVLGSLAEPVDPKHKIYAEIKGFGFSFGLENYRNSVRGALNDAGLGADEIDFVFYNDDGVGKKGEFRKKELEEVFSPRSIPVETCNDESGYALSASSMYHVCRAAEQLATSGGTGNALVISSSYNCGNAAMVIGRVR